MKMKENLAYPDELFLSLEKKSTNTSLSGSLYFNMTLSSDIFDLLSNSPRLLFF